VVAPASRFTMRREEGTTGASLAARSCSVVGKNELWVAPSAHSELIGEEGTTGPSSLVAPSCFVLGRNGDGSLLPRIGTVQARKIRPCHWWLLLPVLLWEGTLDSRAFLDCPRTTNGRSDTRPSPCSFLLRFRKARLGLHLPNPILEEKGKERPAPRTRSFLSWNRQARLWLAPS
jgi:hypothetical protein